MAGDNTGWGLGSEPDPTLFFMPHWTLILGAVLTPIVGALAAVLTRGKRK